MARGCCSYHGGISYCGNNGYYICEDGTRSPTCTCSVYNFTDTSDCNCNYSYYETQIEQLKNKNENLNSDFENLKGYLILIVFIMAVYIVYKLFNKKKK